MANYSALLITPSSTKTITGTHVDLVRAARAAWTPGHIVSLAWDNDVVVYGILADGSEQALLSSFKSAITRCGPFKKI